MTKQELIRNILDCAIKNTQKESEDAIDEYFFHETEEYKKWVGADSFIHFILTNPSCTDKDIYNYYLSLKK